MERERKCFSLENAKKFDQIEYQNKYIKEKYDCINLTVPKGEKAIIKEKANDVGISVNEYIYQAIKEKMASN